MPQTKFTLHVEAMLQDCDDRVHADWKEASVSRRRTLDKYIKISAFLERTRQGDVTYSQEDIARECKGLGLHEVFEARFPVPREVASSKRKVRSLIEHMVKEYHYPVLSISNCTEPAKPAGFWIARTEQEVSDYMLRKEFETAAVFKSRTERFDAHRATWGVKFDPFKHEKSGHEKGAEARLKRIQARAARVTAREEAEV